MEYTNFDIDSRRQVLNGHLMQHEADHFQAILNVQKMKAANDKDGEKEWVARITRAESDARIVREALAALDSESVDKSKTE